MWNKVECFFFHAIPTLLPQNQTNKKNLQHIKPTVIQGLNPSGLLAIFFKSKFKRTQYTESNKTGILIPFSVPSESNEKPR